MQSAIKNGGPTHLKYGHFHFPRVVQVICQSCSNNVELIHREAPKTIEHFYDVEYADRIWNLRCPTCLKQSDVAWEIIKQYPLSNKIEIRGEVLFAWNTDHLDYLISVLEYKEKKDHAWSSFKSYINGSWLSKINKPADIKKLKALYKLNSGIEYQASSN